MRRHIRLAILRNFLDELAKMNFISITNVVVDKTNKQYGYDMFRHRLSGPLGGNKLNPPVKLKLNLQGQSDLPKGEVIGRGSRMYFFDASPSIVLT